MMACACLSGSYLYKLHHRDWVEEVKASESVQPVGGAGDVRDGQGGCVAGKDGVSENAGSSREYRQLLILKADTNLSAFFFCAFQQLLRSSMCLEVCKS